MKKTFDRIAKSQLGKRGLAVALCLVVLISAIGVGSALTSLVSNAYSGSENPIIAAIGVVADGAKLNLGNADEGIISRKGDADLASTGWTQSKCLVHYSFKSGTWQDATMDSSGYMTITTTEGGNLKFALKAEDWWYKGKEGNSTISSVTTNSGANYNAWYENSTDNSNKGDRDYSVTLPSAGTYRFSYAERTKKGGQENAELRFHFWRVETSYTISYNTTTNGSFTTKPTSATSGNSVTFVATPATGYTINTVTVTNNSTSVAITTTKSGNTYTFTMPSANVSVSATFKKATYTITASATYCTVSGFTSPAEYGSTVYFTVTPNNDYALKTLTVKQGSTSVSVTDGGSNSYSFTMPAGNVTITAVCATTTGTAEIYFKSATAWVYHPFITVNDGAEQEMTLGSNPQYLDNGPKSSAVKPKSDTGSLRYAWYKITLSGIDTSKPVTIKIRGNDTYMEATGTFTINASDTLYLACDNLMEGSTLVDISSLSAEARDFYDTPLHMVATAAEIAAMS